MRKMTLDELEALVPDDQKEGFQQLLTEIKGSGNPLENLEESAVPELVEKTPALKAYRDSFFQNGLKKWQENNLDKLYQERYQKEHPDETPEQKELRELRERIDKSERQRARAEAKASVVQTLTANNLPTDFADMLVGDTEEITNANIELVTKAIGQHVKGVKEGILKEHARPPEGGNDAGGDFYTVDEINNMSPGEYARNEEKVMASLNHHLQR